MKNFYLRNSGLNRVVPFLVILILAILGVSVFLLMRLQPASGGGSTDRGPVAIHLVEEFKPENVERTPQETVTVPPRTEWRFDGSFISPSGETDSATLGWQVGPGVADLQVRDGRLVGVSTGEYPIIYAERTVRHDEPDLLYSVEIRMRVSAGANLSMTWSSGGKLDLEWNAGKIRRGAVYATTPIVADNQMRTYVIRGNFIDEDHQQNAIRHVLIRPTDVNEATFEIESVRLVFHREYLVSIPSGIVWQGLSNIFRQTLVAKTPEVIQFPLTLSDRPWLDLALGTVDHGSLTFKVKIRSADGAAEDVTLLKHTIITSHRWEPVQVDLSEYARQDVVLSLSLAGGKSGILGFWGSPVIRNSRTVPAMPMNGKDALSRKIPQGVILIWADALRWDHLNVYGYSRETAPVLKRMAAEGTLFHDCLSQAPWTLPSTVSLHTSLCPTTHGVTDMWNPYGLPASATTLAEVFRDANYATLSFVHMQYAGGEYNLDQGFEELHEYNSGNKGSHVVTAREYIDRLLPWLEEHRGIPFFVFLHVGDPHAGLPYPPYDTLWADPSAMKRHKTYLKKVGYFASLEKIEKAGIDLDDLITVRKDLYDGKIRAMDAEIGRLFEQLKELGLDEKTLVIFCSDHGEEFYEHGEAGHGPWLSFPMYSEVTHVPLIVRWPGVVPEGAEVFETVRTIDLMPTILELCRLPVPETVQGQSLLPLFATAMRASDESIAMSDRKAVFTAGQWRNEPAVCEEPASERQRKLRSDRWKNTSKEERELRRRTYLRNGDYSIILDGWKLNVHELLDGDTEYELYDHRKDALDKVNLADKHPEIVQRLAEEFKVWKEKAAAVRLTPDSELEKKLNSEDLERLRSLGYIR